MDKTVRKFSKRELLEVLVQANEQGQGAASAVAAVASPEELEAALNAENRLARTRRNVASTVGVLVVVAAAAVIISTFFITFLQIRGTSMEPTINEGDLLITNHSTKFAEGDILAFYYNNKVLLKRVIAGPGDWVDMDDNGLVAVNGHVIREEYVKELSLGQTDIVFPYQVPEGGHFVLGDHRSESIDSRSNTIGVVTDEQVIGQVLFRLWPVNSFGAVH